MSICDGGNSEKGSLIYKLEKSLNWFIMDEWHEG